MTLLEKELARLLGTYLESNDESDESTINAQTEITSLGLESVQVMEFIMEVEDSYDIAIDLDQLGRIATVADLANVISRLTQDGS